VIKLDFPGRGVFEFENVVLDLNGTLSVDGKIHQNVVLDLNGTLSVDGKIHPKVKEKINLLAK
jgi:hydroxymethylpyrimidine pyrophosphatase-like HAD family hydrolase